MKRGGALKRYRALVVKTPIKRTAMKRRIKRDPPELVQAKKEVRERSNGLCEGRVPGVCTKYAQDFHHVQPRGRGGKHAAANGLDLCRSCHQWLDEHMEEATAMGLLRTGAQPFGAYMLSDNEEDQ